MNAGRSSMRDGVRRNLFRGDSYGYSLMSRERYGMHRTRPRTRIGEPVARLEDLLEDKTGCRKRIKLSVLSVKSKRCFIIISVSAFPSPSSMNDRIPHPQKKTPHQKRNSSFSSPHLDRVNESSKICLACRSSASRSAMYCRYAVAEKPESRRRTKA